jgi:NADPH:quinone reductase-like Zn-dependent oxidoreductase
MKAAYIEQTGGPEVLHFGDRPIPEPAKGEVLVKLAASGVNFTDLNARSGVNKVPRPAILGSEGAGTVERAGEGVTAFQAGRPGGLLHGAWLVCGVRRRPREDAGAHSRGASNSILPRPPCCRA